MTEHAPIGPVVWVMADRDVDRLVGVMSGAEEVVVDLETTGLAEHATTGGRLNGGVAARVVLASITVAMPGDEPGVSEPTTWVVPLSHPNSPFHGTWRKVLARVCQEIVDDRIPLINQNVKFDAKWVYATCGVDVSRQIVWDTQVSSHLLDEVRSTRLKDRAPETFGIPRWDDHDLTYPGAAEEVDVWDLGIYAARDTYWTWRLARDHRERMMHAQTVDPEELSPEEFAEARLGKLSAWCAMPMVGSLTTIEQRGFLLDVDWTTQNLRQEEGEANLALTQMVELSSSWGLEGAPSTAPTSKWFGAFMDAAVEHGLARISALTPSGRPQWSKAVLVRQAREGSDLTQLVLDQRQHVKKAEYLRSWLDVVSPEGAIHSTYHAGRVITGRLSSSDPNMQQVTKVLKPAFIPRPGHVIVDIDYSQIELRVAAFVSRCQPMIDAFVRGEDLHKMLALRIITDREAHAAVRDMRVARVLTLDDVTPEERQKGKSANFGLLYMMGAFGFREYAETAYGVSMTLDEAEQVHAAFYEMWDGIADWHARTINRAKQTGQVVSPIGRIRRVPDIWDGNPVTVGYAERAAVNAPVQGFGSDLMQIAAASIQGFIPGYSPVPGANLVATVHDDIVAEVPADRWEETTEAMLDRMLNLHPILAKMDCTLDVPLAAEATIGTRWGLKDVGTIVREGR